MPCYEKPERASIVLSRVREVGLGDVVPTKRFGTKPLLRVHDARFLEFLELETVFVLEGGYAIAALGVNAVNVLSGCEG